MHLIVDHLRVWIVDGTLPDKVIQECLAYREDGYWFSPAYKKGHWDGYYRFIKFDRPSQLYWFPTGFLDSVLVALDKMGKNYVVTDNREYDSAESDYILYDDYAKPSIDLRKGKWSFQATVLDEALSKTRGIIVVPTGGGKTEIAAALIKSIGKRTTFLTHRQILAQQTQQRFQKRLQVPVGLVGAGEDRIEDVTVCMVQTAINSEKPGYERLHKHLTTSEVLVVDEVHHVESANTWIENILKIPASWRFGLSATPNLEGSGLALVGLIGNIISKTTVLELVERRVLCLPRIWFVNVTEPKHAAANYASAYSTYVTKNESRNEKIVNVAGVFAAEKNACVTLVNRVNHGEYLTDLFNSRGIKTAFIQGKVSQQERDDLIEMLRIGRLDNLVAMAAILGEGTDIPFLSKIINATGTRGGGSGTDGDMSRQIIQFLGRILRSAPGKVFADYVDIADKTHKFMKDAALARARTLEAEGYAPFMKYWSDYVAQV